MTGTPRDGPGSVPVHTTAPVSSSYARIFPSFPAMNTRPALVGMMPLRNIGDPVLVGPPLAMVVGSSPTGSCHMIVPLFRSYAVRVAYGGLVAFAITPHSLTYRVGGTSTSGGYAAFPPLAPF